jgi:hypothetical protein
MPFDTSIPDEIRCKGTRVNIVSPRLRFPRAIIIIFLGALVVFLGAAAKHSQFDGLPGQGFLSKAIKMAGARIDPDLGTHTAHAPLAQLPAVVPEENDGMILSAVTHIVSSDLSILSPPLRI